MHPKKAEVMSGAQSRYDEPLLRFGRSGLLEHFGDFENTLASRHQPSSDSAVEWEFAFVSGLDCGDAAVVGGSNLDQLLGASFGAAADVEMIADEQQEWHFPGELARTMDGVTVAEGSFLLDKLNAPGMRTGRGRIGRLVARTHHHADVLHSRLQDFLRDDLQGGLLDAIAIDQRLQGESALGLAGGGDDGFLDFHGETY